MIFSSGGVRRNDISRTRHLVTAETDFGGERYTRGIIYLTELRDLGSHSSFRWILVRAPPPRGC